MFFIRQIYLIYSKEDTKICELSLYTIDKIHCIYNPLTEFVRSMIHQHYSFGLLSLDKIY